MTATLPCSMSGMAWVLCVTGLMVTVRPACLKYPNLFARYRPASSTTGRAPTVMCDCSSALADGDADPEPDPDVLDELELLQPAASSAAATPAVAASDTRRRGDLIDAPNVITAMWPFPGYWRAGGQRPAIKLAPRAKAEAVCPGAS